MNQSQKKLPKTSLQFIWIGAIVSLFGFIFAYVGWYSYQLESEYLNNSITVNGTITSKRIDERWETDSETKKRTKRISYYVGYRFQPKGEALIDSESSVESSIYEAAQEGTPVDIQYLPNKISENRIARDPDYVFAYLAMGIGILALLIGEALIFFDIKKRLMGKRLLTQGMLVEGTIKSVEPSNLFINNVQQWIVRYTFRDYKGMEQQGLIKNLAPDTARNFKIGDKGQVRYDKEKPSLNIWVGG